VRVATFNVFSGRADDGSWDRSRFAEAVASLDADVLALQEVDVGQVRSGGADLALLAAEAMGAVAHRFTAALAGTPRRWVAATGTEPLGTPRYGIALLSRLPVRTWRDVTIAPVPVRMPHLRGGHPEWVRDENRVAIVAEIETPAGPREVVCTHLSFLRPWNRRQLGRLVRDLGVPRYPRLFLGDLNMRPRAAVRITGLASLAAEATFPAHRPREQIDHVLGSPGLRVIGGGAVRLPMSDHRALYVDL
jgi:endonuclease/exonuclease/phosphatase family metal-dependent hydrolase